MTRAKTVPVRQILDLFDGMLDLFSTWKDKEKPFASELIALVHYFADPMYANDWTEAQRRLATWEKLDDAQRLNLLRKERGNDDENEYPVTAD